MEDTMERMHSWGGDDDGPIPKDDKDGPIAKDADSDYSKGNDKDK